jgi:hypothetical protein
MGAGARDADGSAMDGGFLSWPAPSVYACRSGASAEAGAMSVDLVSGFVRHLMAKPVSGMKVAKGESRC